MGGMRRRRGPGEVRALLHRRRDLLEAGESERSIDRSVRDGVRVHVRRGWYVDRARTPVSFTVGSFNVLGSQHSRPGGQKPGFPAASVRSRAAAALMKSHGVDIVGTQELQDDQLRSVRAATHVSTVRAS